MENKEINNKVEESQLRQKCNFRGNGNLRFVVGDDVMIRNYVSSPNKGFQQLLLKFYLQLLI